MEKINSCAEKQGEECEEDEVVVEETGLAVVGCIVRGARRGRRGV